MTLLHKFFLADIFPQKFYRLRKMWPFEVSGVDHGANRRDFLIRKDDTMTNLNDWRSKLGGIKTKMADALEALATTVDDLDRDLVKSPEDLESRINGVFAKMGLETVAEETETAAAPTSTPAVVPPAVEVGATPAAAGDAESTIEQKVAPQVLAGTSLEPVAVTSATANAAGSADVAKATPSVEASTAPETSPVGNIAKLFGAGTDPSMLLKFVAQGGTVTVRTGDQSVTIGKDDAAKPAVESSPAPTSSTLVEEDKLAVLEKRLSTLQTTVQQQQASLNLANEELTKNRTLLRKHREDPAAPASSPGDDAAIRSRAALVGDDYNAHRRSSRDTRDHRYVR